MKTKMMYPPRRLVSFSIGSLAFQTLWFCRHSRGAAQAEPRAGLRLPRAGGRAGRAAVTVRTQGGGHWAHPQEHASSAQPTAPTPGQQSCDLSICPVSYEQWSLACRWLAAKQSAGAIKVAFVASIAKGEVGFNRKRLACLVQSGP